MTVGRVAAILAVLVVSTTGVNGFAPLRSSFVGRVTSVCPREELTTELSCPPTRSTSSTQRRAKMSMPPFLKKLGFNKQKKDSEEEEEEISPTVTTIVEEPEGEQVMAVEEDMEEEKELSETEKLMKKVKASGTAGIVSYALWELAFWALSVPVCVFGYREVTGHWPDFSNTEDMQKLGAEAFAFVNFARFAVPLRIGLALSTTPWIKENVVDKFKKEEEVEATESE